jgi:hypothetical protein
MSSALEEFPQGVLAPALEKLGVDGPDNICAVRTTAQRPYTIMSCDSAWATTWCISPEQAVGKSLHVIAGPRSGNKRVREALSSQGKDIHTWVDCGRIVNYTSSATPVCHHLVVGPIYDSAGRVESLIGVSRILPDAAPGAATKHGSPRLKRAPRISSDQPLLKQLTASENVRVALRHSLTAGVAQPRPLPSPRSDGAAPLEWPHRLAAAHHRSTPASSTHTHTPPGAPALKRRYGNSAAQVAECTCTPTTPSLKDGWSLSDADQAAETDRRVDIFSVTQDQHSALSAAARSAAGHIPHDRLPTFPRRGIAPNAPLLARKVFAS